ncbi:hypothetical protein K0C01_09700 [Salinarchaeum sp. IM2453]|uniref:hypothetical protein n=1 Tax=Salinarchaeum sp. IM2453 TaxID=2862870 RepID=UPI001C8403FC|nr:hypothetical protein [Salinarchaeum sp. IM2453]QZA88064.1 hypothetical protein K0C01_09700 [Salinarchaeum sp. IM2453]
MPTFTIDKERFLGLAILGLAIGMVTLVGSFLSPTLGQYYIGDLVQEESYATVHVDESDEKIEITVTSLLNADMIQVQHSAINESVATTKLNETGSELHLEPESSYLDAPIEEGDVIEFVIHVEDDSGLDAIDTRQYEVNHTYPT